MSLVKESGDPSQQPDPHPRHRSSAAPGFLFALAAGLSLSAVWLTGPHPVVTASATAPDAITIDYPLNASVFPPDIAAPTFEWRDAAANASIWNIDLAFSDGSPVLHLTSQGERMKIGEIDPRCISANNKPPELTPEQAAGHTWKPDAATWAAIRRHAVNKPASITITGYAARQSQPLSRGSMQLTVSSDPVGAPIFYRDVPLMPSASEKGIIKPLDSSAIPLIAWRMRNISEPSSHIVMTDLHSCANCHSFSRDGKTLGLDMDGPQNDKGLYAMVPIADKMTVNTRDLISWASFSGEMNPQLRVGFMSQVSPDGKYVMTTIKPPGTKSWQFYYVSNFTDYRFLQVFYPTRGILAWYDRESKKLQPLPGADDPQLVQASAVWSPDGKYLVFARAAAKDPNPADGKMAAYANDPAEVQIQYDLYRIPFNEGRGGTPEPIAGASQNGMSNSFAKVSPDGRWIVYVQARNGQIMRPDGKLYIVPAAGGKARLMNCNTRLMNSWHSFSPNGRWMVFSSKSRSPYTQMFLTHIDPYGNDSPAILIENSTAANRAVNIPEFVNMKPAGIDHIDTPAVDFYKQFDIAADLSNKGQFGAAIPAWQKALAMQSDDARSHYVYGETLLRAGKPEDGITELRAALRLNPHFPEAHNNLGAALAREGNTSESEAQLRLALDDNPDYAEAHYNLGAAFLVEHRLPEAVAQFQSAIQINPRFAAAHVDLGSAYGAQGHVDEAVAEYRKAIESDPRNVSAYITLGSAMATRGNYDEAIANFTQAVELDPAQAGAQSNLGQVLMAKGDLEDALPHLQQAVDLDPKSPEYQTSVGIALAKKGRPADAIPHFRKALELSPDDIDARYYLGKALVIAGRGAEGLVYWKQALQKDPDNLHLLNDTAWVLATSRDDALRSGSEAVPLAEHAVRITAENEPAILGTLAAAFAETGRFDKAVELEQRATALARQQGNAALAENLQARLALYQDKKTMRQ
ncbi:MAG TPA: tetratricopeptide repeat protein [Terracidiphilus sp.]|jgi:tetratricopeptide (TPR) repeat protein